MPRESRALSRLALWFLVAAISGAAGRGTAEAQGAAVGLHAGVDLVVDEVSIGLQGRLPFATVGPHAQAVFYPNLDLFVFADATIIGVDADLIFPFRVIDLPITPYAGMGLGITNVSQDFADDTSFDFNAVGGIGLQTGTPIEPFFEIEASLFGTDTVALILGVNVYPAYDAASATEQANPADRPEPAQ